MFGPQAQSKQSVTLATFGGLVTEAPPSSLSEGSSPLCHDVDFLIGSVFTRSGLQSVYGAGVNSQNFVWIKTFAQLSGQIYTLALAADGTVWREDVTNSPGTLTQITSFISGDLAFGSTAFNREYISLTGNDLTRQYGSPTGGSPVFDQVSQDGPAGALTVAGSSSVNPAAANITAYSVTSNVATFIAANGFTAGEFVQFAGTGTVFDGQVLAAQTSGLSSSQFEVDFTTPDVSSTPIGGTATPQNAFPITSITQPAQESVAGSTLQSAGPANRSAGNTYTIYYGPHSTPDPVLVSLFQAGLNVYVYLNFNGASGLVNGTYQVTGIGSGMPVLGSSINYYFTVQAPNTGYFSYGSSIGATYQITMGTVVLTSPVPDLVQGSQVSIQGVTTETQWNNTWTIVQTPNGGLLEINATSLSGGTATYTYTIQSGSAPVVGDLITVTNTTNGNGIFNVSNASIASVGGGQFTITGFPQLVNVSSAAETGQGETVGAIFLIDPGPLFAGQSNQNSPIFGNATNGSAINVNTTQNIAPGTRQAVVMFLTTNGALTRPSPPVTFTVSANTAALSFTNIPIGPPNVVARWIAITEAGANGVPGAYFYVIPQPVATIVNGQPYTYAPTVINDNVTTSASFNFTDAVLLSSLEIDITGGNQFNLNVLGASKWNINYANRMFYGLVNNKINNFLNMHFDGGIVPQPGTVIPGGGIGTTVTSFPSVNTNYLALVLGFDPSGTPTIVQSPNGSGGNLKSTPSSSPGSTFTSVTITGSASTTGDFLIVTAAFGATGLTPTISDGVNTWTKVVDINDGANFQLVVWTATAASTGSLNIVVGTGGPAIPTIGAGYWELTGVAGTISVNVSGQGMSTAPTVGNVYSVNPNTFFLATYIAGPASENSLNGSGAWTQTTGAIHTATGSQNLFVAWFSQTATAPASITNSNDIPLGWTIDPTNGGIINIIDSSVAGSSYYVINQTGTTQTLYGMLSQSAYQDAYNVNIIQPNTFYSARVMARIPSGNTTGNLVVELITYNSTTQSYGPSIGSVTIPFSSLSTTMRVITAPILTTAFTQVPQSLVLRMYETGLANGADIEVKYVDIFPTAQPVLTTSLVASYVNAPEAFDGVTGLLNVAETNTQPINGAFVMYDQLYLLKSGSMFSTQDTPGSEPSGWQVPEVSNIVGAVGPNAYDVGEEWAVIAARQGLYVFYGKQPIKLSQEIFQVWEAINWSAASTIQVKNDIVNRRILISVPMSTGPGSASAAWLPDAPTNTNPTSPNVMLCLNYLGLGDVMSLGDGEQMHTTMFGTLMSVDMRRKWTIWQIPSPYMNFITRQDTFSQPLFICNGNASGKIYQLSANQLSDDGTAINAVYTTYGFVDMNKMQQNPLLGFHRKQWTYLQMLVYGSGNFYIQALMNQLFPAQKGYIYKAPAVALSATPNDDYERPLNAVGNRVFMRFCSKDVGAAFTLQRVILVGGQATLPIRGNAAQ